MKNSISLYLILMVAMAPCILLCDGANNFFKGCVLVYFAIFVMLTNIHLKKLHAIIDKQDEMIDSMEG